ncbi:MAG: hypothetical protein K9K88_06505 [Desulfobacterales bacterium]|nr:hypothetical protein [Desulfobacterales bacterium]
MGRKIFWLLAAWCFTFIMSGSGVSAEDRSYTKYLSDARGNEILKLTVRYLGKEPRGEFAWNGPYETQTSENMFYGIAEDVTYNVAVREVTFRYRGDEYVLEYHLVGTR